jgi:hypothetical protein
MRLRLSILSIPDTVNDTGVLGTSSFDWFSTVCRLQQTLQRRSKMWICCTGRQAMLIVNQAGMKLNHSFEGSSHRLFLDIFSSSSVASFIFQPIRKEERENFNAEHSQHLKFQNTKIPYSFPSVTKSTSRNSDTPQSGGDVTNNVTLPFPKILP